MSYLDHSRPPEERIQQALSQGPEIDAPGRFGAFTRFRAGSSDARVKYERDYGLQIDVALLDRLHEIEAASGEQVREVRTEMREADQQLRDFTAQLLDNDHRAQVDTIGALSRIDALEAKLNALQTRLQEIDTHAAVATTIASGAADALNKITRDREIAARNPDTATDKAGFVYDEMTARPYTTDRDLLLMTDARGNTRLGYRGVTGPSPIGIGFEDIFRGSEALVRERQRVYLDVVADRGPVVDLGCGRGEMLELLAKAGIEARGVDVDEAMVDRARAGGATVAHGDALEFLIKQEDASLGAIFSAQFIEHLPAGLLPELLEIARTKLVPDGVFIAETVNPHSPRALKAFWVDPTHQHPLFPETMLALCRLTGFEEAEIMFPLGHGDLDTDLRTCGEYAVVAGAQIVP